LGDDCAKRVQGFGGHSILQGNAVSKRAILHKPKWVVKQFKAYQYGLNQDLQNEPNLAGLISLFNNGLKLKFS
jgi:hypothetical protein